MDLHSTTVSGPESWRRRHPAVGNSGIARRRERTGRLQACRRPARLRLSQERPLSFRSIVFPALAMVLACATIASAQAAPAGKLSIIMFGAHPDDCDIRSAGTAAKWVALGHKVRFVSVTNGDAGHHEMGGGILAARRRAEAQEVGQAPRHRVRGARQPRRRTRTPTLQVREQIIAQIRQVNADLVLGPRPNDYHPDHRYTGVLLRDAAFMVDGAEHPHARARAHEEPGVPVLPGQLPEAEPVHARHRGGHHRHVREEDRRARRARVAVLRVAALARRPASTRCRRTSRRAASG